ncbi:hypothetical protein EZS27_004104 [termite gut metagenome]|uniref:Uncharacterized protein n=1 Tax=termite gut metagenome TaxID=433724 RepID=A0A5J4SQR4_9ZZZZ
MEEIEITNGRGFAPISGGGILTFEIQGINERETILHKHYQDIYSRYLNENQTMHVGNFIVPMWGEGHNLYPQEVFSITSENKLLPEVIKKQVKFLFGKGPRLYREIIQGEGEKQHRVRLPVEMPEVDEWLESWEEMGHPHYWEYLKNLIVDYYYVNTCCTKYHLSRARRLNAQSTPAVKKIIALSYIGSDEARLATTGHSLQKRIKNEDCRYVIVGDWLNPNRYEYEVFHRLDPSDPFKYPVPVSFNTEKNFTKWVYAFNDWFKGLLEWIKASNLTPRYLNSYLKNALNAHVHVSIPGSWYNSQKEILQAICQQNLTENAPVQSEYKGVKLVDGKGTAIPFYESMVEQLIACELRKITSMLSGEGKNQGKLWASTKWGEEGWEFKEFPGKFKDFISSLIEYDKRSDQVILAGKGISSSITNVENDGVISKSGSDVYYNYLIYIASLVQDEYYITKEINRAIHLNFPDTKKQGIKLGFWIDIPAKLQDTSPGDRLQQTATGDPKSNITKKQEQ